MADITELPQKTAEDTAHTAARIVFGSIPWVGGAAAEIFAAIVQPPIERRRDEWMRDVGELLSALATKGVDVERLRDDEQFIDTVLQATQVALRNHQEGKRKALQNAIANTAIGKAPNDMLRQMFLRCIDEFTEEHLLILSLFSDPEGWFKRQARPFPGITMGALSHILENAFPAFANGRAIYDQIWKDLHQRGLVNTDSLHGMMSDGGLRAGRASELGNRFLSFVGAPEIV